ncbi:MAG TPA: RHS repeat-associated core domain-containing protein [Candidatus Angelobacter sp.]|jgi:RHS repeat-associated protein|nr:RHS repeat-associated core domain-containing protein [Candidatus Angelobacter sp.]
MNHRSAVILFFLACIFAVPAFPQTQPNVEKGFKPYGSFEGGNLDSVNLQNGNVVLHVPMPFSYPQRSDKLAPKTVLTLNSKSWSVENNVTSDGISVQFWSAGFARNLNIQQMGTGVGLHSTLDLAVHRFITSTTDTSGTSVVGWGQYLTTWDGGVHQLHAPANAVLDRTGTPVSYDAIDNSGYHVELTNPDANGVPQSGVVIDREGNRYSFERFASDCGRSVSENDAQYVTNPPVMRALFEYEMQLFWMQLGQVWTDSNPPPIPDALISPLIDTTPVGGTAGYSTNCIQASVITTITDGNGNTINTENHSSPGDMLGRPPLGLSAPVNTSDFSGCVSPVPIVGAALYTYASVGGAPVQVKICAANFPIQTHFGVPGILEFQNETSDENNGTTTARMIVSLIVLDGTDWTSSSRWGFNYDSYLNITDLGLPLGGSIHYDWTTVQQPSCSAPTPVSRAVARRTVNNGQGNSSVTTYSWGMASNGTLANTVTDALGHDTVRVFTALDGANGCRFYETSTLAYQGSGSGRTLLQQVDTTYTAGTVFADAVGADGGFGNVLVSTVTTTLKPGNKVQRVSRTYDSGPGQTRPIFGNVVTEKETDWGVGQPGAILRQSETAYQWQQANSSGSQPYMAANLIDLPARTVIKDGAGCMAAESVFGYDETAVLSSGLGASQHLNPAPNTVRGNLTSVSKWLALLSGNCAQAPLSTDPVAPPSFAVTIRSQWLDSGLVAKTIDPLGNTATHSYDPAYAGAYSTKTQDALGHIVSGTYDFTTGLLTSFTNANATTQASGNTPGPSAYTTNYVYDVLGRLTSATLPADPAGNHPQTGFSYPSLTTIEHLKKITTSLTDDAFTYFDGLARTIRAKHVLPDGNALIDTTYDALGRTATVTNPYFSTSELTYGVTQNQYDALGRPVQTTRQDGSISSVAYSDNCTTLTDEAGKQRRTCTDGLGRLIEVDEPGDNFPGSQASGSFSVNGSLQSKSGVGAVGATKGSASITISGSNQFIPGDRPPCDPCNPPLYDSGKVYITVNGREYDYFYGGGGNAPDSPANVTQGLVNAIQADAARVVNASVPTNGTAITLTAMNAGTAGNYAFSSGSAYDTLDFSHSSFTTSPTSGNLTGGTDSNPGTTVYDSGTVTAAIGSFSATVNYGSSSNSTAPQVASALASALSVANSPVTATASGSNITITYKAIGTAGNLAESVNSTTSQSQYFSTPSFGSVGGALSGGFDPQGPSLDHAYYVTLYFYDALSNLLCVEQHGNVAGTGCSSPPSTDASSPWRVRRFTYDSLSRLLTAKNPESGLISYSYDAAGNLLQKTSPAANQLVGSTQTTTISYCYDALNRVTAKGYSAQSCPLASPVVTYTYDQGPNAIGHLTSLTDQAGSAIYNYDILGRMSNESRTINGVTKTMSYTYDLDGSIATMTYPSGAVITYMPDSAGRMLSAVDTTNSSQPINYVTGAAYNAAGSLTGSIYGQSGSFPGITNTFVYTNRLQPCRMMASTSGAVSPNCDASWGNVLDLRYDFHQGNGNNGNVYSITNYRDQSRNQTFTYDPLNRLTSAQNAGTDCSKKLPDGHTEYWGNSYSFDAWGNLKEKKVTKCQAENLSAAANTNNRLQDYTYDAAGNMTVDNNHTNHIYDAENRITSTSGFTYLYDADGNRVQKTNGNTIPATGMLYWYMSSGIVAESDLLGNLQSEYVFFDGERIARKDFPGNAISYYFSDHLQTASVITDATGTGKSESDYYPWGGELQFANADSNHYKFTGKERDAETGLDYFGARHYSNGLGRFITPDWTASAAAVPYADFADPQSLNLYTYVRNVPTTRFDPDGHCDPPIRCWWHNTIRDIKAWFKDTEIGAAKGAGDFVLNNVRLGVAAGTSVWATAGPVQTTLPPIPTPKALEPSNETQATASTITQFGLTALTAALSGPEAFAGSTTEELLQVAANRAAATVGPGSGAIYGTKVHTAFEAEVEGLGNAQLRTEQSYLNGRPVTRGTPGSVRVDVVEGPVNNPTAVYDLKTGNATLSPARVNQIQSHLPPNASGTKIPVKEIKPQ